MTITISCTQQQAQLIRDALHNYYHEAKPLKSERAQHLAESAKDCADQLSRRLMLASEQTNVQIFL